MNDDQPIKDWERRLKEVPPKKAVPSSWPQHIRPISLDELNSIGVDADGGFYWHGKPVEIRKTFKLRTLELVLLAAATIGTLLQGVAAMFPFIPTIVSKVLGH